MTEVQLKAPVKAQEVEDIDEVRQPGAIEVSGSGVWYECPCGCGTQGYLAYKPASPGWNFDRTTLTLTPSVHHVGHWHGYLKDGYWVQA